MIIDFFGDNDLVDTQVAIAFGASVQPFTNITPSVNSVIINNAGFANTCPINSVNVIDIFFIKVS